MPTSMKQKSRKPIFIGLTLTGADITGTQLWTANLYHPDERVTGRRAPIFSENIESIGCLVNSCQAFKEHYEKNTGEADIGEDYLLYFRGEELACQWELRPAVMRVPLGKGVSYRAKEGEMLHDLISRETPSWPCFTPANMVLPRIIPITWMVVFMSS